MAAIVRKGLPWVLVVVCALFIIGFSSQDVESSASLSGRITSFIWQLVTGEVPDETSAAFKQANTTLRKLAHMTEYFLLATLLSLALSGVPQPMWVRNLIIYAFCLTFAMCDEWRQTGSDGRFPRFLDITIDMAGVLLSMGVGWCVRRILSQKKRS